MTKRVLIFAGLALSLLALPAASDAGAGVTLYEINERVTFSPKKLEDSVVIFRNATSPLLGFADLGTPLCPSALLITAPRTQRCTVIARGWSELSTVSGIGPVHGKFDVVIAAPVITGTFDGTIDLSLAILSQVPLGSITGTFTITQMADASGTLVPVTPVLLPFMGTFRLPFRIDQEGWVERSDDEGEAFYLADDFMTLMEVRDRERSVGFPTVRLEVRFGP